jgi:hypothetical protein
MKHTSNKKRSKNNTKNKNKITIIYREEFEDATGIIRIRKSKDNLCKLVMKTSKGCCFVYFKINKLRHICTIFQFETTPKLDNMVCSNMI